MTYYREHDVLAWHRHPMTGAVVECVECIPSPGGGKDDLWIIARYTVNGVTRRYVAYLGDYADETAAQEDWAYSDMHAVYSGSPATTISGLGYLEGKTVWVLADGAVHPERTVSGGAITLQRAASKVIVGLPCVGILETMGLEAGSQTGTGQGKIKRVNGCAVRVLRTMGAKAGPTVDKAQELVYRTPSVPMGSAPPAYTGDVYVEWDADYDTQQTLVVVKDKPTPVNVVAVMPEIVTESR